MELYKGKKPTGDLAVGGAVLFFFYQDLRGLTIGRDLSTHRSL